MKSSSTSSRGLFRAAIVKATHFTYRSLSIPDSWVLYDYVRFWFGHWLLTIALLGMRLIPALAILALYSAVRPLLADDEVSRIPPPVYAEAIAFQLTPLSEVLAGRTAFPNSKRGGVNLLYEKVIYRGRAGDTYRVVHIVSHATDQSGVESVGSDTFSYDRHREEIFLISAQTILANNEKQSVGPGSAFIQTPQRQADEAIYTSEAELRIIYPKVAPGVTTEAIVLIHEKEPVIPGHFALTETYGTLWPVYRDRLVLDFPAGELGRVRETITGAGVPSSTFERVDSGRERRLWQRDCVPEIEWEENGPQWRFRGATLWLTTVESWDKVAEWYTSLIAERSELTSELKAQIDHWTAGLSDPRAIIEKLTGVVSTEVRYVGLEFGLAGYKPYPCGEVWTRRYGDCKDKANLLRAMLAYKGIKAHLVLLNTRGMGRIERASPSWLQFNHAILAVEDGENNYLYCDPTTERLPAGSLGLGDLARDVLVVKDGKADWAQTPDLLSSSIRVEAELTLGKDGSLSGWFDFGGSGSDAAYYASYFHGLDERTRRQKMQGYVEQFIPGSTVVDIDFPAPPAAVNDTRIRAYLVRPARSAGDQTLGFPYPSTWLPDVSTQGDRRFPYVTSRREELVTIAVHLPESWTVRNSPPPFSAETPVASFKASWLTSPGKLVAKLRWHPNRAVFPPTEYQGFQTSVRALSSWLTQPLILGLSDSYTVSGASSPDDGQELADFPILPTAEGQMRLLEQKYPEENDTGLRRRALQKVLQWFPHDAESVFVAQVKLALLDQTRDGDLAFAGRVALLIDQSGPRLDHSLRAWAEYLVAKAQWGAEHNAKAIDKLKALAQDSSLDAYRRGWSAEAAGRYLRESDPGAALQFLLSHTAYDSEARSSIVRLIASIYATQDDSSGFEKWAEAVVDKRPDVADSLLADAMESIGGTKVSGSFSEVVLKFVAALTTDGARYPLTTAQVVQLKNRMALEEARAHFRAELSRWLERHPVQWLPRGRSSQFADAASAIKFIKEKNDGEQGNAVVEGSLQLVLYHQPTLHDFSLYTRWALWWLKHDHSQNDLLEAIGEAHLKLPGNADEDVIDGWNLLGSYYAAKGDVAKAAAIFNQVQSDPAAAKHHITEAAGELGLLALQRGDIDAALASFHRVEPIHTAHRRGADYLYVGALLHLERGEYDEALKLLSSIKRQEQKYLDACTHHLALNHLLRAAERPEELKAFWARHVAFGHAWETVLTSAGVSPTPLTNLPLVTDYSQQGANLTKALSTKNAPGFLGELDAMARLAQWVPLFSIDFVTYASRSGVISADFQRKLYECALLLIANVEPVDPQFDEGAKVWEVALLNDLGRAAEARAKARLGVERAGSQSAVGERILRIWAISARGTSEEAEVLGRVVKRLDSEPPLTDRAGMVRVLSDAYMVSGKTTENKNLLEAETRRPNFDAKTEEGHFLTARLDSLRTSADAATDLTIAIKAWLSRRDLTWLPHVAPASMVDPRFASLKPPVTRTPEGYSTAEITKFNLLAAADEGLSPEVRGQSLYSAANDIAYAAGDIRELSAVFTELAAIEQVSGEVRANCMFNALSTVLRSGYTELAVEAAKLPAFLTLREGLRDDFRRSIRALAVVTASRADWETEAVAILSEKPLDWFSAGTFERIIRMLGVAGEFQRADHLIAAAEKLEVSAEMNQPISRLRLEWARLVRTIRDQSPIVGTIRASLAKLPASSIDRTEWLNYHIAIKDPTDLTDAERIVFARQLLERGNFLPESSAAILWLVGGVRGSALMAPMMFPELLDAALNSAATDSTKAAFVGALGLSCDVDQPDVRERVQSALDRFDESAGATELSQTRQAVAFVQALHALRTSREKRPPALFDEVRMQRLPKDVRTALQIRFHQARGHQAEALALIDAASASSLLEPEVYPAVRAVMQAYKRDTEIALMDQSMHTILQHKLPDFWRSPQGLSTSTWFHIAALIGEKSAFSSIWFDRAIKESAEPLRQNSLRMYQSTLSENWAQMAAAANEVLRMAPDVYDVYYQRGIARYRMGDSKGAAEDLLIFTRYCLNSEFYPQAVDLLREISPDAAVLISR